MPTVPRYDQPQVQEQAEPSAYVNVQAPAEAFGGGQVQEYNQKSTQAFSDTVFKIAQEQKDYADKLAVMDADQKMSALETKLLYDPQAGVLNRKGKDTFGLPEQVQDFYTKNMKDLESTLSNDTQRMLFRKEVMTRYNDTNKTVMKHVAGEIQKYDAEVTASYVSNSQDAAIKNFNDPERVQTELGRQMNALYRNGRSLGLPDEQIKKNIRDATSKTYKGVIEQMLASGNDLQAKNYYEENAAAISGEDELTLKKALLEGSLRGESTRRADAIVQMGLDRVESVKATRDIADPRIREETEKRIEHYFSEKKAGEEQVRNERYMQAANVVASQPPGISELQVKDLFPPGDWENFTPEQKDALVKRAGNPANDDKKWATFTEVKPEVLGNMSRADFETQYYAHFDSAHRSKAEADWKAAKEFVRKGEMDPHLTSTITFKERLDNTLKLGGIIDPNRPKSKYTDAEVKLYAQYEQEASNELERYERNDLQGKRKATSDEIQKIIDRLVVDQVFVKKGTIWGEQQKSVKFLTDEERKGVVYVPLNQIPTAEREAMTNQMRSMGKRITTDKLQRAFAAIRMGNGSLARQIMAE